MKSECMWLRACARMAAASVSPAQCYASPDRSPGPHTGFRSNPRCHVEVLCTAPACYTRPPSTASAGIVGTTLGDYIAQHLSHQKEAKAAHQRGDAAPAFTYDAVRTSRLVIYGALVGTPIGHAWFKLLDTVSATVPLRNVYVYVYVDI